jgi:hypothetical protein
VIETGQQLLNLGNHWDQDLRTVIVLLVAGVLVIPTTVAAFRAATR